VRPAFILRTPELREFAIERLRMLNLQVQEPWAIYIAPYKQIRSLEQNAMYWAKVGEICKATGHSKNVIHTLLKREAFGVEIADVGGKILVVTKSSAKVDRGVFSELIDHADELAIQLGVPLT
jgi:hypothetical protein